MAIMMINVYLVHNRNSNWTTTNVDNSADDGLFWKLH